MWTSPKHTMPFEREWVIGAWAAPHTDIGQRVVIVRFLDGRGWFDRDGGRHEEPRVWVHLSKMT